MTLPEIRFTWADMQAAHQAWGCNCGPSALAVAAGKTLEDARDLLPSFPQKRYTNPTMMEAALSAAFGPMWTRSRPLPRTAALPLKYSDDGVVRIQWGGRWLAPGVPKVVAYGYTHWIFTRRLGNALLVFDCNNHLAGIENLIAGYWLLHETWARAITRELTRDIPGADGTFFPTHTYLLHRTHENPHPR